MIKIGIKHLNNEKIEKILLSIKKEIIAAYENHDTDILSLFIKYTEKDVDSLIHHLVFDELVTLMQIKNYYIEEYCQLVYWKDEAQINNKENRIKTIQGLSNILEENDELKQNFFPAFREYTHDEIKSKNAFLLYFNEITSNFEYINEQLKIVFSYDKFLFPRRIDLLSAMEIEGCPYCNIAQVVTFAEKEKSEVDIDHFLLKAKFPLFSSSFGNVIPSCKACNSTYKNVKLDKITNPRIEGFEDGTYFKVKYDGIDNLYKNINDGIESKKIKLNIEIEETDSEKKRRIENTVELFSLNKRYDTESIKQKTRKLFTDLRMYSSSFYQESIDELVNGKNYEQFMLDKVIGIECGSYELEDQVNILYIKLMYDLYKNYANRD